MTEDGTMNARFWVWWRDGAVKLTLRPGQALGAEWSGRHEEGWAYEAERWAYDGRVVLRVSVSDGTDCDGRMSDSTTCACPLTRLRDRDVDGLHFPEWEREKSSHRDYAAEAAGY